MWNIEAGVEEGAMVVFRDWVCCGVDLERDDGMRSDWLLPGVLQFCRTVVASAARIRWL